MTPKRIRQAARELRATARGIRESENVNGVRPWRFRPLPPDSSYAKDQSTQADLDEAKAEHDGLIALARELEALARNAETTSFWVFDPVER